jgi:hypothetical protein
VFLEQEVQSFSKECCLCALLLDREDSELLPNSRIKVGRDDDLTAPVRLVEALAAASSTTSGLVAAV